ncbi:MAG: HIT domain-containing protein [Candidatus Shapirobacteria bacterium]
MDDCIFCKIVKGDIPCYKVYEDENFLGFLDIRPIATGHCLLIPKTHFRWTYDVPNFGQYFEIAKKIGLATKTAVNADYVSFVTFGNEVPHAHIWIIPRFIGDIHEGHGINTDNRITFTKEEFIDFQNKITNNLK